LGELEKEFGHLATQLFDIASQIPNSTHPSVPLGAPEQVKLVGTKPEFQFTPKSHIELGKVRLCQILMGFHCRISDSPMFPRPPATPCRPWESLILSGLLRCLGIVFIT